MTQTIAQYSCQTAWAADIAAQYPTARTERAAVCGQAPHGGLWTTVHAMVGDVSVGHYSPNYGKGQITFCEADDVAAEQEHLAGQAARAARFL